MKSRELVPLINSSPFHQADTKCNLCSKKPKCSVMERGRKRCITQVVTAGDNFLRPKEGIMSSQGAEQHFFQQLCRGPHCIFVSLRETLCLPSHVFSLCRHAHEDHCWHCKGTPSPLCPSRHILAVLPQECRSLELLNQLSAPQGARPRYDQKHMWAARAGLWNCINALSYQHQRFQQIQHHQIRPGALLFHP